MSEAAEMGRWGHPVFSTLLVGLGLCFIALATTGDGAATLNQVLYLVSAGLLAFVAAATRAALDQPSRWAAVGALGGLIATEVFAITVLGDGDAAQREGAGVLLPPAWLFALIVWLTHTRRRHTFRWVTTLVQLPYTLLTTAFFALLSTRADTALSAAGFAAAAFVGVLSVGATATAVGRRVSVLRTTRR